MEDYRPACLEMKNHRTRLSRRVVVVLIAPGTVALFELPRLIVDIIL